MFPIEAMGQNLSRPSSLSSLFFFSARTGAQSSPVVVAQLFYSCASPPRLCSPRRSRRAPGEPDPESQFFTQEISPFLISSLSRAFVSD
jgi:hypothetical protein